MSSDLAQARTVLVAVILLLGIVGALFSPPAQAATLTPEHVSGCARWYHVAWGDTLNQIAWRYHTSVPELARLNGLGNPNLIRAGSWLCVATGSTGVSDPSPPQPAPTKPGKINPRELCQSGWYWRSPVWNWQIPPSCYAWIYFPNPGAFPYKPGWGWCNWWAEELHPAENIWLAPRHHAPRVGAAIFFPPGDQGASWMGHWGGEIIAISPGGQWLLISEMNDYWRGGGFGRVDYRYVYNDGAITFVY